MRKNRIIAIFVVVISAFAGCGKRAPSVQDDLDRKLEAMMKDVTLVGRSTRLNDDKTIGEERYVIEKISKLTGETWLFQARIRYGSRDLPIPVPVVIKWAGDTPVITLTNIPVPGMGTYTARVLLYGDQYAGTWSGKTEGGQIFGKIVRNR